MEKSIPGSSTPAGSSTEAGAEPAGVDPGEVSDGYHTFNELYEHRHALFAVACHFLGGWKSKQHDDGSMFPGWFIAGITTIAGAATYHLPIRLWERFPGREVEKAPAWDGHTANDVIGRLWAHLASLAGSPGGVSMPKVPPATIAQGVKAVTDWVLAHREAICTAFLAKYGCGPDEVEQIEMETAEGNRVWSLRRRLAAPSPSPEGPGQEGGAGTKLNESKGD